MVKIQFLGEAMTTKYLRTFFYAVLFSCIPFSGYALGKNPIPYNMKNELDLPNAIEGAIKKGDFIRGKRGHRGKRGGKGSGGSHGSRGSRGHDGHRGSRGHTGHRGHTGDRGPTGHQGSRGGRGSKGHRGKRGRKGDSTNCVIGRIPIPDFIQENLAASGSGDNFIYSLTAEVDESQEFAKICIFLTVTDPDIIEDFSCILVTPEVTFENVDGPGDAPILNGPMITFVDGNMFKVTMFIPYDFFFRPDDIFLPDTSILPTALHFKVCNCDMAIVSS